MKPPTRLFRHHASIVGIHGHNVTGPIRGDQRPVRLRLVERVRRTTTGHDVYLEAWAYERIDVGEQIVWGDTPREVTHVDVDRDAAGRPVLWRARVD